jgi:FkbM family methyltransferase
MNLARLTWLRNILRKLGITRLLTYQKTLKARNEIKRYQAEKPSQTTLNVKGIEVDLNTADEQEWLRARSLESDGHILGGILKHITSGSCFWDIGSSIGGYANVLGKAVGPLGQVFAFEPETRSFEKLNSNIALNKAENIKAVKIALSDRNDKLRMVGATNASEGTHHLARSMDDASGDLVEVTTIDALVGERSYRVPTAVKIDVEGWEERVLIGGTKTLSNPDCKAVVVEVHFKILAEANDNDAPARILKLLERCHFTGLAWLDASHLLATK